jgi:hypothetical protein
MTRSWPIRFFLAVAAASLAGAAAGQAKSDWEIRMEERNWQESELKLPPFPKPENLIEFEASAANRFRFFVDGQSVSAGSDGAVRYTLVARSPSGAESVSFNGLRCKTNAHKVYATGRPDQTWSMSRDSEWKELQVKTVSRQNLALMRDFFCPAGVPIQTREEGIDALRRGYHPHAVSNQGNFGRR